MSDHITIVFADTQQTFPLQISDLTVLPLSLNDKIQQYSGQDPSNFQWTIKVGEQMTPLLTTKPLNDQGVRYGSEIYLTSIRTSFMRQQQNSSGYSSFQNSGSLGQSPVKTQPFGNDSQGPQTQQFGNQFLKPFQCPVQQFQNINQNMQQNQNQFVNQQFNPNQQNQNQFANQQFNLNQQNQFGNQLLNPNQQNQNQFVNQQQNQAQQFNLPQQMNQPSPQPQIIPPQQFNLNQQNINQQQMSPLQYPPPGFGVQQGQPGVFQIPPLQNQQFGPNMFPQLPNLAAGYGSINPGASISNENRQKQQINSLKKEVEEKQQEIENLENEKAGLKKQIRQLQYSHGDTAIYDEQQEKIDQQEKTIKDLKRQIQELKQYIQELQSQLDNRDIEIDGLKDEVGKKGRLTMGQEQAKTIQYPGFETINLQNQIDDLRKKNQAVSNQLTNVQQQVFQKDQKIRELEDVLDNTQYQQRNYKQKEDSTTQRQIQQLIEANKQLERKIEELNHRVTVSERVKEDRDKQIRELKFKVEEEQNTNQLLKIEITSLAKITEYLEGVTKQNVQGNLVNNNNSVLANIQKLKQEQEQDLRKKKEEGDRQREAKRIEDQKFNEERRQIEEQRKQIQKEEKYKKAMKLRDAILNNQGVLQVGLLVDVTGSMDEYKDATMNVIERAMQCIKMQTNRDCEWGTVCYQDFAELKLQGEYKWLQFTKDNKQMMEYLKKIKCDGGDDGAEDLNGGIKQMIRQLRWDKYFKLALLICDAPSHGTKWAGKTLDNYPNQNLEEGLQELINKNIVLIGIVFNAATDIMFEQMKNFYARQNKQNLLIIVPLKNLSPNQIQENLIQIISEASVTVTEVKQQGTKTKQQLKDVVRDGAFEALVKKLPDPSKFTNDPNIQTIQTTFDVYKVEIRSDSFESNITTIYKLKIPHDYVVQKESTWKCVRTLKPFAFGQLKEVYLMKKADQMSSNEVYVIKMPIGGQTYKTMNEAILECRSHLISQQLMKKFIEDLTSKPQDQMIPQLRYSDFLILKEHDTSFWIAERFFQGQFLKFNNNFGYINPDATLINHLAQTFSYYTYNISDMNYMICDIQGVGTNFTDPAINTTEGGFDDTDQGSEGIAQYIVSFEGKKDAYQEYLRSLDIQY